MNSKIDLLSHRNLSVFRGNRDSYVLTLVQYPSRAIIGKGDEMTPARRGGHGGVCQKIAQCVEPNEVDAGAR